MTHIFFFFVLGIFPGSLAIWKIVKIGQKSGKIENCRLIAGKLGATCEKLLEFFTMGKNGIGTFIIDRYRLTFQRYTSRH